MWILPRCVAERERSRSRAADSMATVLQLTLQCYSYSATGDGCRCVNQARLTHLQVVNTGTLIDLCENHSTVYRSTMTALLLYCDHRLELKYFWAVC